MFRAMDAAGLRVKLKVSEADMGEAKNHPFIRPSDFVKAMDEHNSLERLLPTPDIHSSKKILKEYWKRFSAQFGSDHEVFQWVSSEHLALTVPCRLHGDEGRSTLD